MISGCKTHFEPIAPKSIEIDMEKLCTKFSALNVDFDGPSLDFLGSRKPAHKGIKGSIPVKVVILPLLASLANGVLTILGSCVLCFCKGQTYCSVIMCLCAFCLKRPFSK